MAIEITFAFDNADAAIDFLAKTSGEYVPESTSYSHNPPASRGERQAASRNETPWNDAGPETSASAEADPWADETTASKPAKHEHKSADGRFPQSGEHTKKTPNGDRTWTFGLAHAPTCDCGYTAAKFRGVTNTKPWAFWKCPLGFGDGWRDKCSFSESVKP